MNLAVLYLGPALIGLVAAWIARGQKKRAARIGLAALLALPAVAGWHGIVLAANGAPAVFPAFWATILSAPGWGLSILLGALIMRKTT